MIELRLWILHQSHQSKKFLLNRFFIFFQQYSFEARIARAKYSPILPHYCEKYPWSGWIQWFSRSIITFGFYSSRERYSKISLCVSFDVFIVCPWQVKPITRYCYQGFCYLLEWPSLSRTTIWAYSNRFIIHVRNAIWMREMLDQKLKFLSKSRWLICILIRLVFYDIANRPSSKFLWLAHQQPIRL